MKYIRISLYLLPIAVIVLCLFEIQIPDFLKTMGLVMAIIALSKSLFEVVISR